ncbi:hypothetical protein PMAYCL1PPCAC_26012, partial [Pristionchus mayeri]
CSIWVNNGYCVNSAYPITNRQQTCGVACGFCTRDGRPVTPAPPVTPPPNPGPGTTMCAADASDRCPIWHSNGFCTNPGYTTEIKMQYCCRTCHPYLYPATTTTTT